VKIQQRPYSLAIFALNFSRATREAGNYQKNHHRSVLFGQNGEMILMRLGVENKNSADSML
jgi:hypothetical protein